MSNDILFRKKLGVRDGFDLEFIAHVEYLDPADWCEGEEKEAIYKKLDECDLVHFEAEISVSKLGIKLGSSNLGGCLYENYDDFLQKGFYSDDMIKEAITEAHNQLYELCHA